MKKTTNLYAIKCLQSVVATHQKEINRLEKIECEMNAEQVFADEEIVERKEYIRQLVTAMEQLK